VVKWRVAGSRALGGTPNKVRLDYRHKRVWRSRLTHPLAFSGNLIEVVSAFVPA
jgi:hypothetical protein